MTQIIGLAAEKLSGWDFIIAGLIVVFVEFVIKKIFQKAPEKTWNIVVKFTPILLGAVIYLVLALVQGTTWYTGLIHGLFVGLTAMGSYDVILKSMKESGTKSITDMNEAVKKAVEEDK